MFDINTLNKYKQKWLTQTPCTEMPEVTDIDGILFLEQPMKMFDPDWIKLYHDCDGLALHVNEFTPDMILLAYVKNKDSSDKLFELRQLLGEDFCDITYGIRTDGVDDLW